jgi:hypothetical protein
MLDFIRKQLGVEDLVQESNIDTDPIVDTDNSLVVEYAHLFQELSDVSEEGNVDEISERGRIGGVDISLEDDIDVETDIFEYDPTRGSVVDIPKDATKNSIETESAEMKTYDEFFTEAYENSQRFERESEENHISRIKRKTSKLYQEYVDKCYQEGLFGFGEMDINDVRVPAAIAFDFGSACGMSPTMVQVPFKYITTERRGKRMITKAQCECASLLVSNPELTNAIIADAVDQFKRNFSDRFGGKSVNEILMFQFIGIPKQESSDEYKIYIAADTGIAGMANFDMVYSITKPGRRSSNITAFPGAAPYTTNDGHTFTLINPTETDFSNRFNEKDFLTKNECVQLEYEVNRPRRFDESFYQEAIDFEEGGSDDEGNEDTSSDDSSESNDDEKKSVDTNDVSDEIVEKVSSDEEDGADVDEGNDDSSNDEGDEGASIDDGGDGSSEDSGDEGDDSSVDNELNELDDTLEDSGDMNVDDDDDLNTDGSSSMDIEKMTVAELLEEGENKLKGMTLEQLKKFISGGNATSEDEGDDSSLSDETSTEEGEGEGDEEVPESGDDAGLPSSDNPDDDKTDVELEAFVLTSKNINSELDINIRNCLGILNDSDISSSEIFSKFRKASKKLNKVSAKASNMSKVYTDNERKIIGDMNKALVNLTLELRSKEVASIKEKMKAFVNAAAAVGKIVESKK